VTELSTAPVDVESLRASIRAEYAAVAEHPDQGFHFHTGARLAAILGYPEDWTAALPPTVIESMAGTGNPFALGDLRAGERVVDCGSGAGVDSILAARLVGPDGSVIGVDMTLEMLAKARRNAGLAGVRNVEFREGVLEALKLKDEFRADMDRGREVGRRYDVEWVGIDAPDHDDDTDSTPIATRFQGQERGAAVFGREEGAWAGDRRVYFDCTSGGNAGFGQVWEYDPRRETITFIFESPGPAVLDFPDNVVLVPKTGDVFRRTLRGTSTCGASRVTVRSTTSRWR